MRRQGKWDPLAPPGGRSPGRRGGVAWAAAVLVLTFTCPLGAAQPAALFAAAQERVQFDIPAGPLADVLLQIGGAAGVLVSFSPDLVARLQAPDIRGTFSAVEAVTLATRGGGLAAEVTAGGVVTVVAAAVQAVPARAVAAPVAGAGAAAAQPPGLAVLPRVEILGSGRRQEDGLQALRGSSATRTDVLLADLPQTVSVVTAEALAIQGGVTSNDAMRYVAGVSSRQDSTGGQAVVPALLVRGLPALYALSGMGTIRLALPMDSAFIERIEVPKGPSGTIPGVGSFGGRGGVVNMVRKEAGTPPRRELEQGASSRDSGTGRLEADLAGRLSDDLAWRVVAVGSATGPADGGYEQRNGTGGVLVSGRYGRGPVSATLTVQADRSQLVPARLARGGELQPDGTISPILPGEAGPLDAGDRMRVGVADMGMDLEWRFARQWRWNLRTRFEAVTTEQYVAQPGFRIEGRRSDWWNAALQLGLVGEVQTGPVRHQLLLGLDLADWRTRLADPAFVAGDLTALGRLDAQDEKREVILQDHLRLGALRVRLAGQVVRVPLYTQGTAGTGEARLNWDAGALYRLSPRWSVYAGTQSSVETDVIRTIGSALVSGVLEPTETRQGQAGTRLDFLHNRLAFTLEGFQIRQTNVPVFDGLSFDNTYSFIPRRTVRGLELDVTGRPLPFWELQLGMSFMKADDLLESAGDVIDPQAPAPGISSRSMHLLSRFHLPGRWLRQTRLSLAYRARSASFAVSPSPLVPGQQLLLPGSADLNLALERRMGDWALSGFIRNVFDRDVYESQGVPGAIPIEPGRSIGVTVKWSGSGLRL
jgi:iron complex outermembrane receptor protein